MAKRYAKQPETSRLYPKSSREARIISKARYPLEVATRSLVLMSGVTGRYFTRADAE